MQVNPMIVEFEQAYAAVLQQARSVLMPTESLPLWQAQGRVLAQDVFAPINWPTWPQSAMDGFAINSQDRSARFRILASAFADKVPSDCVLQAGQAQRIMTGAVIPQGCDAIVPLEYAVLQTTPDGDWLLNPNLPHKLWSQGRHIKAVGSDVRQGEKLLAKGTLLATKERALLASVGCSQVSVFVKPKVAVLTLGDELTDPGEPLTQGGVYNANRFLLQGLLSGLSIELVAMETLPDEYAVIAQRLQSLGQTVDCIFTVGGSSVGDKDWLPKILQAEGHFHRFKINMKPAKPLMSAQLGRAQLLALPGNPLATYFSFQLFAKPLLQVMAGQALATEFAQGEELRLAEPLQIADKLRWILVRRVGSEVWPMQASASQLSVLQKAQGFIRVAAHQSLAKGDRVRFFAGTEC
ncbi:molybdopterin molybdotransferase MoeA [Thiosulfatimonas sediminis]|nr:molybdopterin molybdotransferase MoeA [Thiosulfatimonas sediminis]